MFFFLVWNGSKNAAMKIHWEVEKFHIIEMRKEIRRALAFKHVCGFVFAALDECNWPPATIAWKDCFHLCCFPSSIAVSTSKSICTSLEIDLNCFRIWTYTNTPTHFANNNKRWTWDKNKNQRWWLHMCGNFIFDATWLWFSFWWD